MDFRLSFIVSPHCDLPIIDPISHSPQSRNHKVFDDLIKIMVIAGNPKFNFGVARFSFVSVILCWFNGDFHVFGWFCAECVFVLAGFKPGSSANFNFFCFFFGFCPVLAAARNIVEHDCKGNIHFGLVQDPLPRPNHRRMAGPIAAIRRVLIRMVIRPTGHYDMTS